MSQETFKVYVTFIDGAETIEGPLNLQKTKDAIIRLHKGPAAVAGMIQEVKIVDILDCTVFLSRKNVVLFPRK